MFSGDRTCAVVETTECGKPWYMLYADVFDEGGGYVYASIRLWYLTRGS